jgi:hypothetical protein
MAEILEVLAVNFPVQSNVEQVAQIMGYRTVEVSYR